MDIAIYQNPDSNVFRAGTGSAAILKYLKYYKHNIHVLNNDNLKNNKMPLLICNHWPFYLNKKEKRLDYIQAKKIHKRNKYIAILDAPHLTSNGIPNFPLDKCDHIFFNSLFYKRIACSAFNIPNSSIVYHLGPLPCDNNLDPIIEPRKIKSPIEFVVCAKWWKRPFKRLGQLTYFYEKYLKIKYPGSIMNVLGGMSDKIKEDNGIIYWPKSHHDMIYVDIMKRSHLHITLTPYDTGPRTVLESLHYRVPFLATTNCCAPEMIDLLGKCGEVVEVDPPIRSVMDCEKYKPFSNRKHYGKMDIPWELLLHKVDNILSNFEEYTSWTWNDKLNYEQNYSRIYDECNIKG